MAEESLSPIDDLCGRYGDIYKYFLDPAFQTPHPINTPSESSSSSFGPPPLRSMLVTGFGMRNWDSLQRALIDDEQRRQMLLERYDKGEILECESVSSAASIKLSLEESASNFSTSTYEPRGATPKGLSLQYLMGLAENQEAHDEMSTEREKKKTSILGEAEDDVERRMTAAMRKARTYLKEHKIFEFFQFLTSQLLAHLPDNPIEFLTDLLDHCLLYRSGFGNPPLLYEKSHLEQLFYLMDRMRTGFIDIDQYKTGMKTLGICSYDKNPPLSTNGMISKDFFIEEAYECLTDLFVDMIRHRGGATTPSVMTPPPSIASGGQ